MKLSKSLLIVNITIATLILGIGIYLLITDEQSAGVTYGRTGVASYGSINAWSAILLSFFIYLIALLSYQIFKKNRPKSKNISKSKKSSKKL